ncbi:hypothetical protein [Solimicrobium silvestre]|uniref:Uncharacterized protein n=1 Tax=Solimicrobium silvestre TaxID=2099400 RepID=A0A2S9GZU1_9BURK|nr:hypothetical protein [Solimicrobium silvestre]PRC93255.1 hypothetical protein S2091_1993 [Solimicrobium silvestre]
MAEQEISKHTLNALKTIANKENDIWHKLREVALEIFIIVFAVTLSIWMHEQGEHRHEQQQVKSFLIGLKADIQSDIADMNDNIQSYQEDDAIYSYLANLGPATTLDKVKFEDAYAHATVGFNRFFIPHNSRYEGFKSSGKLTSIEDDKLLQHIVSLHEEAMPVIHNSESGWIYNQNSLIHYLDVALDAPEGSDLPFKLITAPKGKRLSKSMIASPQLYERYHTYIELGTQIIKEIELAYPDSAVKQVAVKS